MEEESKLMKKRANSSCTVVWTSELLNFICSTKTSRLDILACCDGPGILFVDGGI